MHSRKSALRTYDLGTSAFNSIVLNCSFDIYLFVINVLESSDPLVHPSGSRDAM